MLVDLGSSVFPLLLSAVPIANPASLVHSLTQVVWYLDLTALCCRSDADAMTGGSQLVDVPSLLREFNEAQQRLANAMGAGQRQQQGRWLGR
jgi:hypothetical protein